MYILWYVIVKQTAHSNVNEMREKEKSERNRFLKLIQLHNCTAGQTNTRGLLWE